MVPTSQISVADAGRRVYRSTMRPRSGHAGRATLLLTIIISISLAAREGDVRLVEAAKSKDAAAVQALVDQQVPVDAAQPDGATALHWAAHWDDLDMANALLRAGADANATNELGVAPLSLACVNGSAALVERLLAHGADADHAQPTGVTPLMSCARSGNVDAVRHLLAGKASVNARETVRGQTALMWAVAERHAGVAETLIAAGAGVRTKSHGGFTPLLFAAQQGDQKSARLLLDADVDINDIGGDGSAALLVATESRHADMVQFLIDAGADVNAIGAGRTALHAAVQHERPDIAALLLADGADPNARLQSRLPRFAGDLASHMSMIGATPFWLAAKFADLEMMRLLEDHGADPRMPADDKTTPLMVAAGIGFLEGYDRYGRLMFNDDTASREQHDLEAVKLALALGGDVGAVNDHGQTVMHGAAYSGNDAVVQLFADAGARLNVADNEGLTPLSIADGMWYSGTFLVRDTTAALLRELDAEGSGGP